jgi:hypothetical protein
VPLELGGRQIPQASPTRLRCRPRCALGQRDPGRWLPSRQDRSQGRPGRFRVRLGRLEISNEAMGAAPFRPAASRSSSSATRARATSAARGRSSSTSSTSEGATTPGVYDGPPLAYALQRIRPVARLANSTQEKRKNDPSSPRTPKPALAPASPPPSRTSSVCVERLTARRACTYLRGHLVFI